MKRAVIFLVAICLAYFLFGFLGGLRVARGSQDWRAETCRYARWDGHPHWTEHEIRLAIACAVQHFPVPGGLSYALCICEHESSFYPHASAGTYMGLFQLSDGEWNYSW